MIPGQMIPDAEALYDLFSDGIEYVIAASGWQPWTITSTEDGDLVAWTWADEDTPTGQWPMRIIEHLPYPLRFLSGPPGEEPTAEVIARAIHDGPTAQAQYAEHGIAPHDFATCSYREQYMGDARAVRTALWGQP